MAVPVPDHRHHRRHGRRAGDDVLRGVDPVAAAAEPAGLGRGAGAVRAHQVARRFGRQGLRRRAAQDGGTRVLVLANETVGASELLDELRAIDARGQGASTSSASRPTRSTPGRPNTPARSGSGRRRSRPPRPGWTRPWRTCGPTGCTPRASSATTGRLQALAEAVAEVRAGPDRHLHPPGGAFGLAAAGRRGQGAARPTRPSRSGTSCRVTQSLDAGCLTLHRWTRARDGVPRAVAPRAGGLAYRGAHARGPACQTFDGADRRHGHRLGHPPRGRHVAAVAVRLGHRRDDRAPRRAPHPARAHPGARRLHRRHLPVRRGPGHPGAADAGRQRSGWSAPTSWR